MKRILIVNYEFPPLGGGGGIAAKVLAQGFIENGHHVDYLTSGFKDLPAHEVVDGIHVYRVPVLGRTKMQTASIWSLLTFPITGLIKGIELCREHRYAFINTHFVVPSGPLGHALARIFSLQNILSIHGGDIFDPSKKSSPHKHWVLRVAIRFLLNHATRVVAQSTNTKENAERYYTPRRPIDIIALPYEPFAFTRVSRESQELSTDSRYLIGIGRLVKRKDFDTLIRALTYLDAKTEALIVGDGPERERLERLAEELGVRSRVRFIGSVDNETKFRYLANADMFVLSSLHEGFGIVLQEAMQVGLPIIATNVGGQTDLVREGINGYLMSPGNPQALASLVIKVLEEPLPGLSNQLAHFAPAHIAHQYEKLV